MQLGFDVLYPVLHIVPYRIVGYHVLALAGQVAVRGTELIVLVVVVVELQQVAAIGGGGGSPIFHNILETVLYGQTVLVYLYLLAQEVVAHMHAVEHQLHALAVRLPRQAGRVRAAESLAHLVGDVEGHAVAHQRAVYPVGQQAPALVLLHSEDFRLRCQLDGKGLLGEVARRVSAQAEAAVHFRQRSDAVLVDGDAVGLGEVGTLGGHRHVEELHRAAGVAGHHHHGKARVGHRHHIVAAHASRCHRIGHGRPEILRAHAAGLLRTVHRHSGSFGHGEGRH